MKSLLAKTLASTALAIFAFSAAHAGNHNQSQNPFPSAAQEFSSVPLSPALIRYFEQREAAIAKELKGRHAGRFDYIPKSNSPRLN